MISLFFSLLVNFFSKRRSDTLNCGIFAWVGPTSDQFSPVLFNVLGVYNDQRGGDSCGVYFNRGMIHGIGPDAKYEDLVKSKKLHTTIKPGKWPVVIGHCRKASSGAVTNINVQPVEVRYSDSKRLNYIQAHNGTITNHKELADKYKVSYTASESDSVVMARIINKQGFDVLAEYEGSAALVMHFIKEPNSIYAFHGESKDYNVVREERPLHFLQIPKMGTYISSEARPLEFISNGLKATSFKYNTLYKLTGDKVEEVRTISRINSTQKKYTPATSNNYGYSDAWKDEVWDPVLHRYVKKGSEQKQIEFKEGNKHNATTASYSTRGVTANICASTIDAELYVVGQTEKLVYAKGLYGIANELAHGRILCDGWGWVRNESYATAMNKYVMYFAHGIMLTGKEAYDDIMAAADLVGAVNATDFYRKDVFDDLENMLHYYSVFPFTRRCFAAASGFMTPSAFFPNEKGKATETYYSGSFQPLFSSTEYDFDNGDLQGYSKSSSVLTIDKFLKENEYFKDTEFAITLEDEIAAAAKAKPKTPATPANDDDVVIFDCTDCCKYNLDNNNQNCCTCEIQFGAFTVGDIKNYDKTKKMLLTLLKDNLSPMVDDLEQLEGDIKEQDKASIIKAEYDIIVEVRTKLNKLI